MTGRGRVPTQGPGTLPALVTQPRPLLRLLDQVRSSSNVGALIAAGEGDGIEFKPHDLRHRVHAGKLSESQAWKEVEKALHLEVTKTLAERSRVLSRTEPGPAR